MKVVILAGGFGTRLSEETDIKPKPMVEIGGRPILWHIMKIYSHYGFQEFIICLGYKGYLIKEYFANYLLHNSDVTIHMGEGKRIEVHSTNVEPWTVTLVDTGYHTQTGGRIKGVKKFIGDETFMMTYGDGLTNLNIAKLVEFHRAHGKKSTITAIQPPGRFGSIVMDGKGEVLKFQEKPQGDKNWINGGFLVLEPEVLDYIEGDQTVFEREPLEDLSKDGQLVAYQHQGFWRCMDTLRDRRELEAMWSSEKPYWKVWED